MAHFLAHFLELAGKSHSVTGTGVTPGSRYVVTFHPSYPCDTWPYLHHWTALGHCQDINDISPGGSEQWRQETI